MSRAAPRPLAIEGAIRRWRLGADADAIARKKPLAIATSAPLDETWSEGDCALLVPPAGVVDDPAALARALSIDAVPIGGWIVVVEAAVERGWARLLGRRAIGVARGVRGAALLLGGCRRIGGGVDPRSGLDLAWGVRERPRA